jgi:hypothetical protein
MRKLALLLPLFLAIGCHAQVSPTAHSVALTWASPTGGTPPYSYVMSRVTVATGTKTCPTPAYASGSTPATYAPLNSADPVSALAYTDSTASGTECYTVQAEDSVQSIGGFSNTAGPFVLPTNPAAPQSLSGAPATAHVEQPALPLPGDSKGPAVIAKLEGQIR